VRGALAPVPPLREIGPRVSAGQLGGPMSTPASPALSLAAQLGRVIAGAHRLGIDRTQVASPAAERVLPTYLGRGTDFDSRRRVRALARVANALSSALAQVLGAGSEDRPGVTDVVTAALPVEDASDAASGDGAAPSRAAWRVQRPGPAGMAHRHERPQRTGRLRMGRLDEGAHPPPTRGHGSRLARRRRGPPSPPVRVGVDGPGRGTGVDGLAEPMVGRRRGSRRRPSGPGSRRRPSRRRRGCGNRSSSVTGSRSCATRRR
jgi:hypothetical protein